MRPLLTNKIFGLLITFALLIACSPQDEIYTGYLPKSKITLHSYICPDSTIRVKIGRTRSVAEENFNFTLPEAKAQLWVNGEYKQELIRQDKEFLTSDYSVKEHDLIRIVAQAPGYEEAWGETRIPARPEQVQTDTVSAGSKIEYAVHIPASSERKYYRLLPVIHATAYRDDSLEHQSSWQYTIEYDKEPVLTDGFESASFANDPNHFRIFTNKRFEGSSYTLRFKGTRYFSHTYPITEEDGTHYQQTIIYRIEIKLQELTPEAYHYLHSVAISSIDEGWEPLSIFTNIHKGIGIIGGFHETSVHFDCLWRKY